METDMMRMQREAEQRVRELREKERRASFSQENGGRTAEGLAENRTEWMHASGFQPLSEYKARHMPRQPAPPKPESMRNAASSPAEKRGDAGLLSAFSAASGFFIGKKRRKGGIDHRAALLGYVTKPGGCGSLEVWILPAFPQHGIPGVTAPSPRKEQTAGRD